ncbi:hypothetical protein QCA50_015909 [Cerrena zonata]|uniref:AB hydrolase-1 domain-containing protein n=1 Tax=Cerrena zonata TaxID=2478898 RepID=A0AAW0FJY5_9APHY
MSPPQINKHQVTSYHTIKVNETDEVFYRKAGDESKPNLLLLHGFPTSSRQYEPLINLLNPYFNIIAPDLPSYGLTKVGANYEYTFDKLAQTIDGFLKTIGGLISQNGNAYEIGVTEQFWSPFKIGWDLLELKEANSPKFNQKDLDDHVKVIKNALLDTNFWKSQYYNAEKLETLDLDLPLIDYHLLINSTEDKDEALQRQVDLAFDYRNNIKLYPKAHEFFRKLQLPTLAVWGNKDDCFDIQGAYSFKKDVPSAKVVEIDGGHFAGNSHTREVAQAILDFAYENGLL